MTLVEFIYNAQITGMPLKMFFLLENVLNIWLNLKGHTEGMKSKMIPIGNLVSRIHGQNVFAFLLKRLKISKMLLILIWKP